MQRNYFTSQLIHIRTYKKSPEPHFPQTAFVICYMLFAPLFGYLGDRLNRKYILMFGLALWSAATLVGRDGLIVENFEVFTCEHSYASQWIIFVPVRASVWFISYFSYREACIIRLMFESTWVNFFDSSKTWLNSSKLKSFLDSSNALKFQQNQAISGYAIQKSLLMSQKQSIHQIMCRNTEMERKVIFRQILFISPSHYFCMIVVYKHYRLC